MIRLAEAHAAWVLGYVDEVWWSRLAQPRLHPWSEDEPLHLMEHAPDKHDPDPKAVACYGVLRPDPQQIWLRFVEGRPGSALTTQFLAWGCEQLYAEGKKAGLLVWDNASWHLSAEVRNWIRAHNRLARQSGGVRLLVCQLPSRSPWLNPIEPRWMHGKRAVAEPERKLTAQELTQRVCDYYGFTLLPHLSKKVA